MAEINSPGFGVYDLLSQITVNGKPLKSEYRTSVIDLIFQKTNQGATTSTLQVGDPFRYLLNTMVHQGDTLELDGISTTLVQFLKAGDQLQLVFESSCIYRLNNQRGHIVTKTDTGVTPFMAGLVGALNKGVAPTVKTRVGKRVIEEHNPNYVDFVGPDYSSIWHLLSSKPIVPVALGRGTTADPYESSWTAMSRIASAIGWRLWEDNNTIYFGPDEWWSGDITPDKLPPINKIVGTTGKKVHKLSEFTPTCQDIDFDWDVGKAFADAAATLVLENFTYQIGEIVELVNMGPGTGFWMVSSMQRDAFTGLATLGLSVPMPFAQVYDPTSLPIAGFPLPVKGVG
jgi:hypothetical protein